MLTVFKKYLGWLIAGEAVVLALAAALIHDDAAPIWPISVCVVLSLLLLIFLEGKAGSMHQRLLGILYVWQKPKDFVQAYSPLLKQEHVRGNIMFSMRAYLSNGYAAMGSFSKALSLLEDMPALPKKRVASGEALIAGNRCGIYLSMGDAENARSQYQRLCDLRSAYPKDVDMRKLTDASELLSIRLALEDGESVKADADHVREELKKPCTALHKTELRYLLGMLYSALGEAGFAKSYLSDCVSEGGETWLCAQAKEQLKTLDKSRPAKS